MKFFWLAFFILMLHSLPASAQPIPGQTYGPTSANDTLWSIATRVRPNNDVSVQQMVLALYQYNPKAFKAPNINALRKGHYLKMPSLQLINKLSYQQAKDAIKQHDERWSHSATSATASSTAVRQRSKNIQVPTQTQPNVNQQKEINRLQRQIKKLSASANSKDKTIRSLRSQVRRANQRANTRKQDSAEAQKLRQENQELNERIDRLQGLLEQKLDHLNPATLEGKNLQLERQLMALQKGDNTGTATQATIAINPKTQAEISALQNKLNTSESEQKNMSARVEQLESELNKQHTRIQQLKETLVVASNTIQKQQQQNTQMYERLKVVSPEEAKAFAPAEGTPRLELKGIDALSGGANTTKPNGSESNTQKNVLLLLLALFLLPILLLLAWLFHYRRKKARGQSIRQQKLKKQKEQRKDERHWIKGTQQAESTAMAEADLYMSYGDYTQALAVILNAIHADPIQKEYKVKHLEILQKTGNREAFDAAMLKYWEELMTTHWRDKILAMQKTLNKKGKNKDTTAPSVISPVLAANSK